MNPKALTELGLFYRKEQEVIFKGYYKVSCKVSVWYNVCD